MSLNYRCVNNVSDDDCNKCMVHGFMFDCPNRCPDFDDGRTEEDQDDAEVSE